jgi:F-type H+-transporting ATPase subunit a
MAAESHDPLDPGHLVAHVKDAEYFEVPRFLAARLGVSDELATAGRIPIPQVYEGRPVVTFGTDFLEPFDLRITKFMVLEVVAAVLMAALFIGLASKIRNGRLPNGRLWNLLEAMLVFIRDKVARPAIGEHDADRFLPFLWTIFFFVLGCNLLGLVPWLGSPTGAFATTGALAFITFLVVIGSGMRKLGTIGFWKAQVPHMDLPGAFGVLVKPMVFVIEVLGLIIRHFVLSVRLLANMAAGHLVLAVLIAFIAAVAHAGMSQLAVYSVGIVSVFAATALSMLELFVAFLQAYIFVFLSALFIGMAVHPH